MNLRRKKIFRRKSWLGKLLRLPFKLIPLNKVFPILSGHLKGKKWITGSHNMSILFGTYEVNQSRHFSRLSKDAGIFWDLGSHVGYYSLLFYSANPKGEIFAFEPVERNYSLFKRHMEINGITNFELFSVAVSDRDGELTFSHTSNSVAGKLDENGETRVKTISLGKFFNEGKIPAPQIIKMDIEGAELSVLQDMQALLISHQPTIFLSTHGAEIHRQCLELLKSINYQLTPLDVSNLEKSREVLATPRSK